MITQQTVGWQSCCMESWKTKCNLHPKCSILLRRTWDHWRVMIECLHWFHSTCHLCHSSPWYVAASRALKWPVAVSNPSHLHPQKASVLVCSTYTSAKLATNPNTWSWLVTWLERRIHQFLSPSSNTLQEPKTSNYLWHHAVDTWDENKSAAKQNQRSQSWEIETRKTGVKSYQP